MKSNGRARPRLVVLDGFTANPGDLSWAEFEAVAECTVWDRTPAGEVAGRIAEADAVLLNKAVLGAEAIAAAPRLRYVGILATGCNTIDLPALRARGVAVRNVPGYSTASVAQCAIGLLLELANRTALHAEDVRAGGWSRSPDYAYTLVPPRELAGRVLGVVGFGAIGRRVAEIARALGMEILVNRRDRSGALPERMRYAELDELFAASDAVSLHCPLTEETRGLASAARIASMKPGAWLVNTARGPLVDEAALAAALREGRLGGAGLDVLSTEPPPPDNPLLGAPNTYITPHIAWATPEARRRLLDIAARNFRDFLEGKPNPNGVA